MMRRLSFARFALIAAVMVAAVPVSAHAQNAFDDPGSRVAAGGGGGDFAPVNPKVDAGSVTLGSSSQIVVLFKNNDSKPIRTGAINLYPSSNITATIGENQCAGESVQPGEVCAISVQAKGLQAGQFRIEMLMRHDGRSKLLTATVDGTVASAGDKQADLISDIEIIPEKLDFGTITESQAQAKTFILRNKTAKTINITDVSIDAGVQSGLELNTNCAELQTGAACVASVSWLPQKKGAITGALIVKHDGATGVSTGEIIGTYSPTAPTTAAAFPEAVPGKGLLVSSQQTVDFGSGVSQISSITVSLVNSGDAPVQITKVFMSNTESGVRAEKTGCGAGTTLAPLEACPLTLTWEPVREGSIVDDVQVAHSGARGLLVLPIRGNAAKAVNKDKKALSFGTDPGADAIISRIQPLSMNELGTDQPGSPRSGNRDIGIVSAKPDNGEVVMQGGQKTIVGRASSAAASRRSVPVETGVVTADVRGMLDGYSITSYSQKRAIVTGPGGSRVVFNGERTVIGGILWEITMRPSAVEFKNGEQKVLLLFDKSLSSVNVDPGESNGGGGNSTTPISTPPPAQGTSTSAPANPST